MPGPVLITGAAIAMLAAAPLFAADAPLFELADPKGDDDGAGALIYPNRDDMQPGDLDLVRFSAERGDGGVWFEVEMAQAIRSPVGRVTEVGQTPMEKLARLGFYTFNVDIYVDQDRIAGSGRQDTVPGRGVSIDRAFAWDRAVVLTPRPDIARTMLQMHVDAQLEGEQRARSGKVTADELEALQRTSESIVGQHFFFPNKVRVSGRRVSFFVPQEFLGEAPAPSWAYTVVVTGADLEQTGRLGLAGKARPSMMTMTVARGNQWAQWGVRAEVDEGTPPVIDLLAPAGDVQKTSLSDYDAVAGRLAAIPGVAPDGRAAMAGSAEPATPEQLTRIGEATGGTTGSGARPSPTERRTVPARLRTLNELLADGLITQAEYNELRRKILAEL